MITSQTQTGIPVTLTGLKSGEVRVEFTSPQLGSVHFTSAYFGTLKGAEGILGYARRRRLCVTVPRADFEAAIAEARAIDERKLAALKSGTQRFRLAYRRGSSLSGWSASGRQAGLLVELGLAEEVSGWGYYVPQKVVDALGEEFTYAQALEYTRPAREAAEAKQVAQEQARREKFAEAARTGQPVKLQSWNEPCCEHDFECDLDIVTEYAQPDGSTRRERIHTH